MLTKPLIVAFSGPKGSGKTTAAKYLVENYGFVRHPFAKPLKEMLKCIGLTDEHVNGNLKEVPCPELGGKTPRQVIMWLGTDLFRHKISENVWVNAWKRTMPGNLVVVDDVRFPNEYDAIKEFNGSVLRIKRSDCVRYERKWWDFIVFWKKKGHESESYELPYDCPVYNNGNLETFYKDLEEVMEIEFIKSKILRTKSQEVLEKKLKDKKEFDA